jgi:uncharacterized 2Fe-2S/4Fe-4S cluster protein (DUF4445 family)
VTIHGPAVDRHTTTIARDGAVAAPVEGLAVDLGTTNIDARLYRNGEVTGAATMPNPGLAHGKDILTRIDWALRSGANAARLQAELWGALEGLAAELSPGSPTDRTVFTGNTAMLHFLMKLSTAGFAAYPFESVSLFGSEHRRPPFPWFYLPPCIGPFLGADLVSAVLALRRRDKGGFWVVDLGTNCEIAWCPPDGPLWAASAAAGPAFSTGTGTGSSLIAAVAALLTQGIVD